MPSNAETPSRYRQQLSELNDRLEKYILKIHNLEEENDSLQIQVKKFTKTSTDNVTTIGTEIQEFYVKNLTDETTQERERYMKESVALKLRIKTLEDEANSFKNQAEDFEIRVKKTETRAAEAEEAKKRAETELTKIQLEVDTLQKKLATANKQLKQKTEMNKTYIEKVQKSFDKSTEEMKVEVQSYYRTKLAKEEECLDRQIETYRKLLEKEEERLKRSASQEVKHEVSQTSTTVKTAGKFEESTTTTMETKSSTTNMKTDKFAHKASKN